MTYSDILDELNDLAAEYSDLIPFVELLEDIREDEGLPPFTPEEKAAAEMKVNADAARAKEIDARRAELIAEAKEKYGCSPHYSAETNSYWP